MGRGRTSLARVRLLAGIEVVMGYGLECGTSIESQRRAIAQNANIPPGCRAEYRLYVDFRGGPIVGRDVFLLALAHWAEHVEVGFLLVGPDESPHCRVRFEELSGSILAWSHLADNTCRAGKEQRYDIRGWSRHLFFLTVVHEIGHLMGLVHMAGTVMNPGILTHLKGLTQGDLDQAVQLGYRLVDDDGGGEVDWVKILELILKLIAGCDKEDAWRVLSGKRPLYASLKVRRVLRGEGLRGAELRDATRQVLGELESLGTEDVQTAIDEAAATALDLRETASDEAAASVLDSRGTGDV